MSDDNDLSLREQLEKELNSFENEENEENGNTEEVEEEQGDGSEEGSDETGSEEGTENDQDVNQHESDETSEDQEDEGSEQEVVAEVLEAPEHWAAEDRELFSSQSEAVKGYLIKRHNEMETGFNKKTQDLAEQRRVIESLAQFQEKWEPHTNNLGVPLIHGLEKLLEADQQLRSGTPEQRQQVALQLMSQYGINMNVNTPEEDVYTDPQLKAMQDQINTLNGNITARDQKDQQDVVVRQQTAVNEAQSAINAFKEEKDEKGNLKYQHFGTLEKDIGALVQSGQAGSGDYKTQLDTAYKKALWMNDTTREQLLVNKQSSLKEETIKKQSKAAAQAKKSAKANKKGTTAKADKPKAPVSLRDDLEAQIREAQGA